VRTLFKTRSGEKIWKMILFIHLAAQTLRFGGAKSMVMCLQASKQSIKKNGQSFEHCQQELLPFAIIKVSWELATSWIEELIK